MELYEISVELLEILVQELETFNTLMGKMRRKQEFES